MTAEMLAVIKELEALSEKQKMLEDQLYEYLTKERTGKVNESSKEVKPVVSKIPEKYECNKSANPTDVISEFMDLSDAALKILKNHGRGW